MSIKRKCMNLDKMRLHYVLEFENGHNKNESNKTHTYDSESPLSKLADEAVKRKEREESIRLASAPASSTPGLSNNSSSRAANGYAMASPDNRTLRHRSESSSSDSTGTTPRDHSVPVSSRESTLGQDVEDETEEEVADSSEESEVPSRTCARQLIVKVFKDEKRPMTSKEMHIALNARFKRNFVFQSIRKCLSSNEDFRLITVPGQKDMWDLRRPGETDTATRKRGIPKRKGGEAADEGDGKKRKVERAVQREQQRPADAAQNGLKRTPLPSSAKIRESQSRVRGWERNNLSR